MHKQVSWIFDSILLFFAAVTKGFENHFRNHLDWKLEFMMWNGCQIVSKYGNWETDKKRKKNRWYTVTPILTHTHTQVINKTIKIPSLSILFDLEIFMCVTLLLLLTFIPLDIFNIFDAKILKASHITLANNYRICNIWINCNAQPPT